MQTFDSESVASALFAVGGDYFLLYHKIQSSTTSEIGETKQTDRGSNNELIREIIRKN